MKSKLFLLFGLSIMCMTVIPVEAQENWGVSAFTYLWGAGLDGEVGVGGLSVDVDQSFGDILQNLDFGFSGGVRVHRNRWAFMGDFMYIDLGTRVDTALGHPIDVDVDQWLAEGDLAYQVATSVEVFGGARLVSLQNRINFLGPAGLQVEADKTWVDPILGLRIVPRLSESLYWWNRFDIGGFGAGSDFTWQLNTNLVFQFSDHIALSGGYRVLSIDYKADEDTFVYDATSHGPILGLVYTF